MQIRPVRTQREGFVLVFTLMVLAFLVLITQRLMQRSVVATVVDASVVDRQRAQMLALGGITLARAQLTAHVRRGEETAARDVSEKGTDKLEAYKTFLTHVRPMLNSWQTFNLTEKEDGVDGTVRFCISCENGKIDINQSYDFKKQQFKPEVRSLIERIVLPNIGTVGRGEFLKLLEDHLKKRQRPLRDISELRDILPLRDKRIFYDPSIQLHKGEEEWRAYDIVTLGDVFTVFSGKETIEPWMLSRSIISVLSLEDRLSGDEKHRQDIMQAALKKFSVRVTNWDASWHFIEPLYGGKPEDLQSLQKILSQQFDPDVYTVISSGSVRGKTQQVIAVLQAETEDSSSQMRAHETVSQQQKDVHPATAFKIVKIYWL